MSPLLIVILIVFVDLIGFSIVMPLLPRLAASRGYSDLQIGLIFAAYPLCQLVAGPILGRLSDRYGRRPVLVFSQAGTALSFVILAMSNSFGMMLFGRMLDGASGGNFLVAQAYVADVSKPENRARSLGLIGAAFGIGFVVGPLLGGLLIQWPTAADRLLGIPVLGGAVNAWQSVDDWRLRLPFFVAAAFSTIAWVLVLLKLPESLPKGSAARQEARVVSWRGILDAVRNPQIGGLIGVAALSTLAFAALEGTFSLFLLRREGWGADKAAYAFALFGLVSAIVQGGLIRRLVPKYGESRLALIGYATVALGFAGIAASEKVPLLLGAVALAALGQGLAAPSITGLLSRVTPMSEQGAVFGTLASAQTLARLISYPTANVLMGRFGESAPYWGAATVGLVTLTLASVVVRGLRDKVATPAHEEFASETAI
jgi:MFS transporter, DHA1 family, tetracycline resistance protein